MNKLLEKLQLVISLLEKAAKDKELDEKDLRGQLSRVHNILLKTLPKVEDVSYIMKEMNEKVFEYSRMVQSIGEIASRERYYAECYCEDVSDEECTHRYMTD